MANRDNTVAGGAGGGVSPDASTNLGKAVGGVGKYDTNGAISAKSGKLLIIKAGVCALTLAAPVAGDQASGGDDGKELTIISGTANAHTVTQTTPGFNNGSTSDDVATFGGAVGDGFSIIAYNGEWLVRELRNVTLG